MNFSEVQVGRRKALGIQIPLPKAPLVLILAKKGFLMCGYLDIRTAIRLGDTAVIVKGVKTVNDMLGRSVIAATPKARRFGIRVGMSGAQALAKLF